MIWACCFVHCVPLRISPVAVRFAVNPFEQTQVVDLLITNDNKPDVQVLVEELRQLQRWVAPPMVEQKGNGVGEDFAQQPACQMPEVARPHPLYGVTSYQLRKDGLYPVAKTAQISAPYGVGISFRKRSATPSEGPAEGLPNCPRRATTAAC